MGSLRVGGDGMVAWVENLWGYDLCWSVDYVEPVFGELLDGHGERKGWLVEKDRKEKGKRKGRGREGGIICGI